MSKKLGKFLIHTAWLPVAISALFIAPACSTDELSLLKNSGGVSVSTYDSGKFGGTKCSQPDSKATIRLAFAEGTNGLQCEDNWVTVDPNSLPDVEDGEERSRLGGSDEQIFQKGLEKCNGTCVRIKDGKHQLNLPRCWIGNLRDHCDGKVYEIVNKKGEKKYGFSHSVCPARHWKNVLKKEVEWGELHCGKGNNHVDIGYNYGGSVKDPKAALREVGLSSQSEGLKSIKIAK